jgi:signal transduction histidine kinase
VDATRRASGKPTGNPGGQAEAATRRGGRDRTIVLAVLHVLLVWAVAAVVIWQNHRNAVDDWKRTSENTSLTVAAYLKQTLGAADLVLKSIQDWISEENITSESQFRTVMQERRFIEEMRERMVGLPQIGIAGIIARTGELLNNTHTYPLPPVDLSDREVYRGLMAADAPALLITAPARGRTTDRWTFYLVRKVTPKSGEMLGLVTVGLDVDFLTGFFRSISIGDASWLSLFRDDGTLLATSVPRENVLGNRYENGLARRLIAAGGSGKAVFTNAPTWFDPAEPALRIVVPRRIDGYPVYVSLVIGESVFLTRWRESSYIIVALALALTGVTFFAALRILRLIDQSAAARRAESERHLLAAIVDTPSALTAVLDRSGDVVHTNTRFREVFGADADIHEALRGSDLRGAERLRAFIAGDDGLAEIDLEFVRPGHQTRMLHFSLSRRALPDSGDCVIMVGHDETVRRQAQHAIELSSRMVTLGEAMTGIAHELSQPLNVIRMAAQNALTEIGPEVAGEEGEERLDPLSETEFRRFVGGKLHRVILQVDRAADTLARMRMFSREARQGPQQFDVRDACRGALSLAATRLRRAGITSRQNLGAEPLMVVGHQTGIEQGILNLLLNAAEALQDTAQAEKWVEVAVGRNADGGVEVLIGDNGPGVPAAIRDRIFEPFFTTKPSGQGTGLGLASTFGIVRDTGGTLTLVGDGPGATFRIGLPAAPQGEPAMSA